MHTFEGKRARFHFNSDLSGNVDIVTSDDGVHEGVSIPASDLLAFVAKVVRRQRIAALEQASDEEILALPQTMARSSAAPRRWSDITKEIVTLNSRAGRLHMELDALIKGCAHPTIKIWHNGDQCPDCGRVEQGSPGDDF